MKQLLLLLLLSVGIKYCIGQPEVTPSTINLSERTPSAPNTASLSKYFEIPVNMSTGLPNIQIPIYTIETGNIKVPITLTYHAGGVRVNEISSWVGLGWSLKAGASISKRVNGFDDLFAVGQNSYLGGPSTNYIDPDYSEYLPNGVNNITDVVESVNAISPPVSALNVKKFFGRIAQGRVDGEADEYFFNTPDGSGSYFYNQKLEKFQSTKPDGWYINSADGGGSWTLKSNAGNIYNFIYAENVKDPIWYGKLNWTPAQTYLPNAWYPNTIVDPVNNKQVTFGYTENFRSEVTNGYSMFKDYEIFNGSYNQYYQEDVQELKREGYELALSAIAFDQGTVVFVTDTSRRLDSSATGALKEIKIYNNNSVLLKKFVFTYFYTSADTSTNSYKYITSFQFYPYLAKRLFLSSVQEINYDLYGNSFENPPYTFNYNSTTQLPMRFSFAQDMWGYSNGKNTNTKPYPTLSELTAYGVPAQSNRDIDTSYTKSGTLIKITYPTGGSLNFDYENHDLAGGLRVKKVTNYDSVASKNLITEYDYLSSGSILGAPKFWYQYIHIDDIEASPVNLLRIEGESAFPLFPNQGSPVLYSQVLEKKISGGKELRTMHFFTDYGNNPSSGDFTFVYTNAGVPHNKLPNLDNFIGIEYKTQVLKHNTNNTYSVINTDSLIYSSLSNEENYTWNVQSSWSLDETWITWFGNDPYNTTNMNVDVSVKGYKLFQQSAVKTSQFSISSDGQNNLTQFSGFEYDSIGNTTKIKSVNSTGDTTIKIIKYPTNFSITGATSGMNLQIDQLMENNITSNPVEIVSLFKPKNTSDTILQDATFYEYSNLKINKIYKIYGQMPYSTFIPAYNNSNGFYKDSKYTLEQEVVVYDANKNPLTVISKLNTTSYVWDTLNTFLIAEVKNASYQDVAATSFENGQKGRWTFSGHISTDSTSPTGAKRYSLSTGNITKSGLTSGTTYIVSYWSKNGSYTLTASNTPKTGKLIDGWTYYEHEITGTTSLTISNTSDSGYIDELRLYPKGALMATFSHIPLMGMSSQCDANNRISYYKYDGLGRLKLIKDQDKNIIKKFTYKYNGEN